MEEKSQVVSIILAVRNEVRYIEAVLDSLRRQVTPGFDLEILVVDGHSSDGTAELVTRIARLDPRIRLLINEQKNTPAAFNLGLKEASGEYVCIMGGHTIYDADYVAVSLEELKKHGAVGCSGRVFTRPGANTRTTRLIAWSLSHPFGTSTRSARTQQPGFVDTIAYPVFRRDALIEVGGYDPQLLRNQDIDMSGKLRARGYRLFLTDQTHCQYFVKPTLRSLWQYCFRTGYWNVISFRQRPSAMKWRHFVPFLFVLALLFSAGLFVAAAVWPSPWALWFQAPFLIVLGLHLLAGSLAGIQLSIRKRSVAALLAPLVFLSLHCAYGAGTLWGVVTNAKSAESSAHCTFPRSSVAASGTSGNKA
jgi:succinoglycan biosynthesis protein ExoA